MATTTVEPESADAVARRALRDLGDGELVERLRQLDAAQRRTDAERLALVGELDARRATLPRSGLTMRRWLAHELGAPGRAAWRATRTARTLRDLLPVVASALADGRLTVHHAELLAVLRTDRIEPHLVDLQLAFVDLAQRLRFDEWERHVRDTLRLLDTDGPAPARERDHAAASHLWDGGLRLLLELHGPFETEAVLAAIDVELQARLRHHRKLRASDPTHVIPGRARLRSEAVVELLLRGHAARGADLRAPSTGVTLVVHAADPTHAATLDGRRLSAAATRLLCCDAGWAAVVVDSLGVPLDAGRKRRFFSAAQRRAILVRDGGCVHPGCSASPRWVHVHHLLEWDEDGATDLRNGVTLCPTHHGMWHRPDWHARPDPDDPAGLLITTPAGTVLRSQRHLAPRPFPTDAAQRTGSGVTRDPSSPVARAARTEAAESGSTARCARPATVDALVGTLPPATQRAFRRAAGLQPGRCGTTRTCGDDGGTDPPH